MFRVWVWILVCRYVYVGDLIGNWDKVIYL